MSFTFFFYLFFLQKTDMNNCQIAWGANYEPTLAMISQSFGKFRFIACHSYLTFFISLSQPKELLIIYIFFFLMMKHYLWFLAWYGIQNFSKNHKSQSKKITTKNWYHCYNILFLSILRFVEQNKCGPKQTITFLG